VEGTTVQGLTIEHLANLVLGVFVLLILMF
jgi:hypothetical protein